MSSIRSIENRLTALVETQDETVRAFAPAVQKLREDRNAAAGAVNTALQTLVVTGDDSRYAALTRAAKASGASYDFTQTVKDWTAADAANREERASLEKTWGTKEQLAQKAAAVKQEIDIIDSAIKEIVPEVAAFDATTKKIKDHNAKYPKAQITEESDNGYKKFGYGRFFLYLTFINRGPHKAYKIVHGFTKNHGDYFEKARDIGKVRQNESKLENDEATRQKTYSEEETALQRMETLDSAFRGPEGMARDIRGILYGALLQNANLAQAVAVGINDGPAQSALLASAKIRALDRLDGTLQGQVDQAQSTLNQLQDPVEYLRSAVGTVGNETVYFDIDGLERTIAHAERLSRGAARDAAEALRAIETYQLPADPAAAEKALQGFAAIPDSDARLSLDFSGLKSSVSEAVDAYEREQARLAELARLAAIAAQQAAAQEEAARRQREESVNTEFNRRSSDDLGQGAQQIEPRSTEIRQNSEDISNGSEGIGGRDDAAPDNISDASSGVDDRGNDSIKDGSDGISPCP